MDDLSHGINPVPPKRDEVEDEYWDEVDAWAEMNDRVDRRLLYRTHKGASGKHAAWCWGLALLMVLGLFGWWLVVR